MRISVRMRRELEETVKNIEYGILKIRAGMESGCKDTIREGAGFARHYAEFVEADLNEYWKEG